MWRRGARNGGVGEVGSLRVECPIVGGGLC